MFDRATHSSERVVVHASGTGSRGPRVGRRSRLAGPRPGTGALAGPGRASTTSHPSRKSPRTTRTTSRCTAEELAEIGEAAADELLAVEAASTGRRGPGQPGSARVFPGESSSPAAAFGPGMVFDVLPGCAQLAVAADAAAEDDRFAGISEAELVGVLCAWDRVEAHARGPQARGDRRALARRNPAPEDAEFTADQVANALGESRFRADELTGTAGSPGHSPARHEGGAARRRREPGQGPADRHRHRPAR